MNEPNMKSPIQVDVACVNETTMEPPILVDVALVNEPNMEPHNKPILEPITEHVMEPFNQPLGGSSDSEDSEDASDIDYNDFFINKDNLLDDPGVDMQDFYTTLMIILSGLVVSLLQ
ncbi:unnamed protein product [Lactuca saligna]|uniref:Uncharacterized protein n=1 Tax=Lactuca saligna TaxID=75948 RepID=A0AA35YAP6_LACSI|nr:unnamed protein product [Lactuca saligna]